MAAMMLTQTKECNRFYGGFRGGDAASCRGLVRVKRSGV